jgi:hypothetical protein
MPASKTASKMHDMSHLDKALPHVPKITLQTTELRRHRYNTVIPGGHVWQCDSADFTNAQSRMPQLRQSTKWAKVYGWAEIHTASNTLQVPDVFPDDLLALEDVKGHQYSKRELSFEQQRAAVKPPPISPQPLTSEPDQAQNSCEGGGEDYSSPLKDDKVTMADSSECWGFVKPAITLIPRKSSEVGSGRQADIRKSLSAKKRDNMGRSSLKTITLPAGVRTKAKYQFFNRKDVVSRRRSTSLPRQLPSPHRRNGSQKDLSQRRHPSLSTRLSLHDLFQEGAFAEDCGNWLKSLEAKEGWFIPVSPPHKKDNIGASTSRIHIIEENAEDVPAPSKRRSLGVPSDGQVTASQTNLGPSSPEITALPKMMEPEAWKRRQIYATALLHPSQARAMRDAPSLRSITSTDTLAGIEFQVRNCSNRMLGAVTAKHSPSPSTASSAVRYSGPPPNIPLPALPSEADDSQSDRSKSFDDFDSLKWHDSDSSVTSLEMVRRTIKGPRADKVREQRLRDIAKLRRYSPGPTILEEPTTRKGPGDTTGSERPIFVNDILRELDRFPTVPDSRPTSTGSASARSSPVRRQSPSASVSCQQGSQLRASASQALKSQRQVLSQSNIFVVVDSDPLTARFRASAMSPICSIAGSAPPRSARSSKLKTVVTHQSGAVACPESPTINHDPNALPILGRPNLAPPLQRNALESSGSDIKHPRSSSEDTSPRKPAVASPKKRVARTKKRRRWNSEDIDLIKVLQRDLEDYYNTIREQAEKIKWQANQIQMMSRVFAPMNRARGGKAMPSLQESPDLPPMTGEITALPPLLRNSWAGSKDWRQRDLGARSPLSVIEEQSLNGQLRGDAYDSDPGKASVRSMVATGQELPSLPREIEANSFGKKLTAQREGKVTDSRYYRL